MCYQMRRQQLQLVRGWGSLIKNQWEMAHFCCTVGFGVNISLSFALSLMVLAAQASSATSFTCMILLEDLT